MKILFVAPWLPSELRPRSLGILRELTSSHDVAFVGLDDGSERQEELHHLAGLELVRIHRLRKIGALLRAARSALLSQRSLQVAYVDDPRFSSLIADITEDFNPDVAFFNVIRSSAFIRSVGSVPIVYDFDELRSDYYRQTARDSPSPFLRQLGRVEHERMARAETWAQSRSSAILVSSPADADPHAHPPMILVRSPIATRPLDVASRPSPEHPVLLFVGRMSYAPNVAAARWFALNVLPRLTRVLPQLKLRIVGDSPAPGVSSLASDRVTVTGYVDDLDREYRAASIAIIPVTMGTGVQLKLLQAMAAGVPTVVTSSVASRAGIEPGVECLTADSIDEWSRQILDLCTQPELRSAVAHRAQAWVAREYEHDRLYAGLHHALSVALGRSPGPRPNANS